MVLDDRRSDCGDVDTATGLHPRKNLLDDVVAVRGEDGAHKVARLHRRAPLALELPAVGRHDELGRVGERGEHSPEVIDVEVDVAEHEADGARPLVLEVHGELFTGAEGAVGVDQTLKTDKERILASISR